MWDETGIQKLKQGSLNPLTSTYCDHFIWLPVGYPPFDYFCCCIQKENESRQVGCLSQNVGPQKVTISWVALLLLVILDHLLVDRVGDYVSECVCMCERRVFIYTLTKTHAITHVFHMDHIVNI